MLQWDFVSILDYVHERIRQSAVPTSIFNASPHSPLMSISRFFLYYLLDIWVNEHVFASWGTGVGLQCCELCVIAVGMVRAYNVAALSRVITLSRVWFPFSSVAPIIATALSHL